MTTTQRLLTADEFFMLPGDARRELVQGMVIEISPVGGEHGVVVGKLLLKLGLWAEQNQAGYVGAKSGFVLARQPDQVRAPDTFFVRGDRVEKAPRGLWSLAPDLAVEVVSPSESAADVYDKVQDYLAAGTQAVWVVYPTRQAVVAYAADGSARSLAASDTLRDAQVLPGFQCQVSELFG